MTKCFYIEETGTHRLTAFASWGTCSKNPYGASEPKHHASMQVFEGPEADCTVRFGNGSAYVPFHAICEYCQEDGGTQNPDGTGQSAIWIRKDTGQLGHDVRSFGVGALYHATWQHYGDRTDAQGRKLFGFDWDNLIEPPLHVVTPGGEWNIDSRASNCTLPNDKFHRCWVRHGAVPDIHVDKSGVTCGAGAGSIICGNYHGFLHHGHLTGNV